MPVKFVREPVKFWCCGAPPMVSWMSIPSMWLVPDVKPKTSEPVWLRPPKELLLPLACAWTVIPLMSKWKMGAASEGA